MYRSETGRTRGSISGRRTISLVAIRILERALSTDHASSGPTFHCWPRIGNLTLAGIVQRDSNRRNVIVVIIVRKGEIDSDKDGNSPFAKTLRANMTCA